MMILGEVMGSTIRQDAIYEREKVPHYLIFTHLHLTTHNTENSISTKNNPLPQKLQQQTNKLAFYKCTCGYININIQYYY